jgi:hypothetical protein
VGGNFWKFFIKTNFVQFFFQYTETLVQNRRSIFLVVFQVKPRDQSICHPCSSVVRKSDSILCLIIRFLLGFVSPIGLQKKVWIYPRALKFRKKLELFQNRVKSLAIFNQPLAKFLQKLHQWNIRNLTPLLKINIKAKCNLKSHFHSNREWNAKLKVSDGCTIFSLIADIEPDFITWWIM